MSPRPIALIRSMSAAAHARQRVVLVSNRLPVMGGVAGAQRPSNGGLAAGLRHVARRWPAVWIGWDGVARPRGTPPAETTSPWESALMVALSMDEDEVARFYRRYSNSVLWPTLHGRGEVTAPDPEDFDAYRSVNERFARAVVRQLRPGDRVWVHDYHLLLLPEMLRRWVPELPIAFFLHTSFPDPEALAGLPQWDELLRGVLAADTIGFHTSEYARCFLRAVADTGRAVDGLAIRGDRDRLTRVRVHPMGIDVDGFAGLAADPEVMAEVTEIRRRRGRLLVGVDRLDYTKGIPQRLLAFEALLEQNPGLRGEVSLIQVAVPSRGEIPAYRDLREVVEALVRRINRTYGRPGWTPVEYLYGTVDLGTLVALYRAADVMVVTPVRDGLNLVAKEFVASRTDGDGVLVLSRFAGAATELGAALQVDPNRIHRMMRTFHAALTMRTAERRRRMRALRRAVAANTVLDWASRFVDAMPGLGEAPAVSRREPSPRPSGLLPRITASWAPPAPIPL